MIPAMARKASSAQQEDESLHPSPSRIDCSVQDKAQLLIQANRRVLRHLYDIVIQNPTRTGYTGKSRIRILTMGRHDSQPCFRVNHIHSVDAALHIRIVVLNQTQTVDLEILGTKLMGEDGCISYRPGQ
jgi:hypothetical protein